MTTTQKRKRNKIKEPVNSKRRRVSFDDVDTLLGPGDGGIKSKADDEDEEEWIGFGGGETEAPVHNHYEGGKKAAGVPAGHEVRAMKEATALYKSNSFKLKIDSLLPAVRPKYNSTSASTLESVLRQLHKLIFSISPVLPQHPLRASAALLERGVAVPYCRPLPTEETNWKVAFERPVDVKLVGSWANKLSVKANDGEKFTVDIGVEMPNALFQEKDYLNGRFFHKRAFYIAAIAAALKDDFPAIQLSYQSTFGDPRLTTLVLRSPEDKSNNDFSKLNAQIRIIPILQSSSPIPLRHLSPSRCNIRLSTSPKEFPTPFYNSALLLCLTPVPNLLTNYAFKNEVQGFEDALALLRVWANQRGYGEGPKGWCIDGFEGRGMFWSSILALLIKGEESSRGGKKKLKGLGTGPSSYQLFKAALGFLARHDFGEEPVYVKRDHEYQYTEEYETHHQSVFLDPSSAVNLVSGIPPSSLEMLRYDATVTLELLDASTELDDSFSEVFLQEKRHLSTRFDVVLGVDLSSVKFSNTPDLDVLDMGSPGNFLLWSLALILRRGLGNRIKAIAILHPSSSSRPLTQAIPYTPSAIKIGLILDSENAFRLVDHGPSAEQSESDSSFRKFWGESKAELRRFKDGKIMESVVWEIKTLDEKARIPGMIVTHLLGQHFGIEESTAITTWQSSFDNVLRLPVEVSGIYDRFSPKVGFKTAMSAFDTLVKTIKELADLPLTILNVSPASEYLRYTSVFSPVAIPPTSMVFLPPWMQYLPTMDIVLEFEKSPKWPDELVAIQKMKLAFFEQIARSIMETRSGTKASVVTGDSSCSSHIEDHGRLEIVTPEGWAFSARIWHDREATLLDRIIDSNPHAPQTPQNHSGGSAKEKHHAARAKEVYLRRFIYAPKHHRAILNLCHHYTAFAGTVRLLKRWFSSHWLLKEYVSQEAVELVCAKVFVGDGKDLRGDLGERGSERPGVPVTKERGFAQAIEFLMEWRWEDGLAIPIYGSGELVPNPGLTSGSSAGAWRLFTEEDSTGRMWTSDGPDAVVARRVTSFAKATWETLQRSIDIGSWDARTIYNHPTSDYDFVIELDAAVLPRSHQNIHPSSNERHQKSKYMNLSGVTIQQDMIRPSFDPAQLFLDDLKRVYGGTIMVFGDIFGGDRIGGIWLPALKESRQFKVLDKFSHMPLKKNKEKGKEKGLVTLNQSGVLAEIERIGDGLIKNISVRDR